MTDRKTLEFSLKVAVPADVTDEDVVRDLAISGPGSGHAPWTTVITAMSHQGWANYPTWAVIVWLQNSRDRMEEVREHAHMFTDMGDENPDVRLADWLRAYADDSIPEDDGDNPSGLLLNYALEAVDWLEIAREFMKEEGQ